MASALTEPLKATEEQQRKYGVAQQPALSAKRAEEEKDVRFYTPDNLPTGVKWAVDAIEGLLSANSMDELCKVMPCYERDLIDDAQFTIVTRKGHLRVEQYLITRVVKTELVTKIVRTRPVASDRNRVEIEGTYYIYPRRTWVVWPTLLLPKSLPIQYTVVVGVRGPLVANQGRIEYIIERWHNWPPLPALLRLMNGLILGALPHATEPLWSYVAELLGDDFYRRKRQSELERERARERGEGVVESAKDLASNAFNTAIDYGDTATRTLGSYARYAANNVTHITKSAAERASEYSQSAYERVRSATEQATKTAREMAAGAAESVQQTATGAGERARATVQERFSSPTHTG